MVKEIIKKILQEELEVPEEKLKEETLPLTGEYFRLAPRDMLYLLKRIENEYCIIIELKELLHYEFSSIDSIAKLIENKYK